MDKILRALNPFRIAPFLGTTLYLILDWGKICIEKCTSFYYTIKSFGLTGVTCLVTCAVAISVCPFFSFQELFYVIQYLDIARRNDCVLPSQLGTPPGFQSEPFPQGNLACLGTYERCCASVLLFEVEFLLTLP